MGRIGVENALVKFEFLDGDYYKFNDSEYRYDDISSLKSNIGGMIQYLYSNLTTVSSDFKGALTGGEVLFSIIDTLDKFFPNKKEIISEYLKEILNSYVQVIYDFNRVRKEEVIVSGMNGIDTQIFNLIDNRFSSIDKYQLIFGMAKNIYDNKNEIHELYKNRSKLKKELDEAKAELSGFKNSKKNKPAVQLYHEINQDFLILEKRYRSFFISTIILTLVLTIGYDPLLGIGGNLLSLGCSVNASWFDGCDNLNKPVLYPFNGDTLKFVMFKLTVLIVGVTLTTYFLRLSGFYQLKQEQAKQTKLELSAFPDFVSGMDPSVANNLRQELALKYFGKEIDKTMIEKNGDLFQEQIKAGTELIKASAEMVKTVKPTTAKEEDSEKKE